MVSEVSITGLMPRNKRASKSIERGCRCVPRTKRGVLLAVCKIRGRGGAATKTEQDHTPRARIVAPSFSHLRAADFQHPRLVSSSRAPHYSWPFHLISSFTFVRLCSTWPLPPLHSADLSLFLVSRSFPPDFFHRGTDREGYLSRVFLATGTAEWSCVLGLMLRQEGRKECRRWMMQGEMIGVCIWDPLDFYALIASCCWSIRLFANF